jgi:hypothetical protein
MGGHGGLNILPQKSWNVYNREARVKVEKDEREFAGKQEQTAKRLQSIELESRVSKMRRKTPNSEHPAAAPLEAASALQGAAVIMNACSAQNLTFEQGHAMSGDNPEWAHEKQVTERKLEQFNFPDARLGRSVDDATPWWMTAPDTSMNVPANVSTDRNADVPSEHRQTKHKSKHKKSKHKKSKHKSKRDTAADVLAATTTKSILELRKERIDREREAHLQMASLKSY